MQRLSLFLSGALFGTGLLISGMTRPAKVIGFLDFAGSWDPSLMFVMGGALTVYAALYRLIVRRRAPVYAARFEVASGTAITPRLLAGAAIFGVGWGLAGYCPGPALVSIGARAPSALAAVAGMAAGMLLYALMERRKSPRDGASRAQLPDTA